jgi:D-sedoheptulose 7-phosphate isomerase
VVLISSSGNSPNVVAAAKYAREHNLPVVTFTGFSPENKLKAEGDINFWLDSKAYNIIECTHMIWMTLVVDMLVGNAEYSAS